MATLQLIVAGAFVLVAGPAVRLWWRHRSPPTAWLAGTFCVLAAGVVAGRVADALHAPAESVQLVARLAIVTFPYLLFRFVASFQPASRPLRVVAGILAGMVVAATAVMTPPPPGDDLSVVYVAYLVAVLTLWSGLSALVAWRLWQSGQGQPIVTRRRLRTLALAAATLNLALVLAGLSATADRPGVLSSAIQGIALVSAVLFYTGFAPPALLRQLWRRSDERVFWGAEGELIAAASGREVVSSMLPRISRLLGGVPVLFANHAGEELTHGTVTDTLRARVVKGTSGDRHASDDVILLSLRAGRLGVATTPATMLFGSDEVELLERLGTLMDLAWTRSELYDREQEARGRAESLAAELESLVYGLSHDLRRPIVSVLGYAECLVEDYGPVLEGDGLHFLSRLRANVEYMDELVEDLLTLSRVGRIEEGVEPVDLSTVVDEAVQELAREYPLATVERGALPVVLMDRVRSRQLFSNLIANALLHGGRPDVTVWVHAPDGDGCVAVADDGRGIPEGDRQRAFGLFERLDAGNDVQGTGIGLAMCRRIVEQAGGRIWVADSDEGTDIRLQLPLAPAAATDTGTPEPA